VLSRQVTLGTLSGATRGKFNFNSASLYAETGLLIAPALAALQLEPYTGLFVARMHRQAFTESTQSGSDAFALTYAALSSTETSTLLGIRLRSQHGDGNIAGAAALSWNAELSWRHRLGPDNEAIKVAFANASDYGYSVQGSAGTRDMVRLSAGAAYALSDFSTAYAQTYVASGQGTQSYGATVGVRWWW
jgi:outer membrane autotransporter protein